MSRIIARIALLVCLGASQVSAQDVRITETMPDASFVLNGQTYTISRNQDQNATLDDEFAKTSRACPPFCVTPISAGQGIENYGELEVIAFLKNEVVAGTGLLIDARVPQWFARGTIPGAVNVPFTTLEESNPYRNEILRALGATSLGDTLEFSNARQLVLFCNGPWCEQSPRAIRYLRDAGYPAALIKYYRGGMQDWQGMGLSTSKPQSAG